jgi:uncharacterized membrane protein
VVGVVVQVIIFQLLLQEFEVELVEVFLGVSIKRLLVLVLSKIYLKLQLAVVYEVVEDVVESRVIENMSSN